MDRDKAIIDEAIKRARADRIGLAFWTETVARHALDLDRSGWQPIDPDVLAVREIAAAGMEATGRKWQADRVRNGEADDYEEFQAALAAYKKHKGGGE